MIWQSAQQSSGGIFEGIIVLVFLAIWLAITVTTIAGGWKMFVKGGRAGWECIIPFWNIYAALKIAGRPGWYLIFFFIPFVNLVFAVILANDIAKSFGRGIGTTIGLFLLTPIFVCILGFGSAQYQGPAAVGG